MNPGNSYYGHDAVLAQYCEIFSTPLPDVAGYLQHGWNAYHGFGFNEDIYPDCQKFVWSERVLSEVRALGWNKCVAIGSPWAYMLKILNYERLPEKRSGVLVYPFHGWEGGRVTGDHQAFIDQVKAVESEPITVCLYWLEYEMPEIRNIYEVSGFRVICHGHRDSVHPGSEKFLYRQYEELSKHRRVVSNRLSTAIMYAASLGCEVAVYGDPMRIDDPGLALEQRSDIYASTVYPEFFAVETNVQLTQAIARRELGIDILISKSELRGLLGWSDYWERDRNKSTHSFFLSQRESCHFEYLFSVILTTYNRPGLLKDALVSIGMQTLRNFEVVLINDHGGPLESLLAGLDFPVTYVYQGKNRGLSAARNAGLSLARGRYIVYLDDDDVYLPNHLAVLAQNFKLYPESVVYTAAEYVAERLEGERRIEVSRSMPFRHETYNRDRLLIQNYIPVNTWAHPRDMLATVGEFDTNLSAFEDWDMLLRLAARYSFIHVPQVTAEVHQRPSSSGDHMLAREQKNFCALYQEMYERHSDLGSEVVRAGRHEMLKRMGLQAGGGSKKSFDTKGWLQARSFTPLQKKELVQFLQRHNPVPSFAIVILDLRGEKEKLMVSLASLGQPNHSYASVQSFVLTVNETVADEFAQVIQVTPQNWLAKLNEVLSNAVVDWFVVASVGDEFTENGLLMAGLELRAEPDCRAVYCDELYRQGDGSLGAVLRPCFNLDYLLSFPAGMARHWLFRRDTVIEAGGFDTRFPDAFELELILRLIDLKGLAGLGHISEPLLISSPPALANVEDELLVIINHLQARGYENAKIAAAKPGRYSLDYNHSYNPVVSILILAGMHLGKLQRCIEGLLAGTAYQLFEIILIDSGSGDKEVHEWLLGLASLQEPKLNVLQHDIQNVAAMLNQAVNIASGDYLLFLAPDIAIVEETWLDNLLNHAQRAEVGGVGGKLLTPDGKIAQAMQILGLQGPLGNPYVGEKLDEPGYMQRLQVDQNVSALSPDCLMLPRELYLQLEGLDEGEIPAPYAMTDLCLRIREAGYLLVWSPSVQLMLDRQVSTEVTAQQQDAMYAKWLPQLARDPFYNPNFSLAQPGGFKLADTQISWRPLDVWRPLPVVLAHPADTMGCGHYRVMQPFNALREAGMIDGALSVGLMHVVDLERYNPDAVILQRQIGEERLEAMRRIKAFSRAFKVYELDDYLPNLPMKSVHRQHMSKDIVKSLRKGLSYVDRFVVSTDVMAEAFADFHPDIRVVKNRLDPRWWGELPVSARRVSKKPRVGWAGGSSHTGDLEMVADVVKELADEVEWVFFGMCPEKLKPYVHEFHEGVAIEGYAKKLASLNLDLALAPVEQNLFNECKSNLRLLEYGACGFPVICSDVRCYQGDGLPVTRVKNRFRDWVDAIRAHINDLDSAAREGDELRSAVLNGWMLEGENLEAWRKVWLPD